MKRIYALALAVLLALAVCAQAEGAPRSIGGATDPAIDAETEAWCVEKAKALAEDVRALASDERYIALFTGDGEISAQADAFAASVAGEPERVTVMPLPSDMIASLALELGGSADMESEAARRAIERRAPALYANLINGAYGAVWVAMSSVLTVNEAYLMPEGFAACVATLTYPAGGKICVTFGEAGEGIVGATAVPLAGDAE